MAATRCALAALAALTAGCSVSRPQPISQDMRCNLSRTILAVNTGGNGGTMQNSLEATFRTMISKGAADVDAQSLTPDNGFEHLVLSGGGQHGAFGTGFLAGMAPLPDYDVVTGVSTGALQAPLALLGREPPPGDRRLDAERDFPRDANRPGRRNVDDLVSGYTITAEKSLYNSYGTAGIVRRARMGDLAPLRDRIGLMITDETLRRLAELDPAKKQLFMLILNWDTGNAEQVDMLDLARRHAKGDRRARDCFLDVMIAASSEPLGTPPVLIDDHLYVDAGLRFGVFARAAIDAGNAVAAELSSTPRGERRVAVARTDIIRNGDMTIPVVAPPEYSALDIVNRARVILVNQVYLFSIDEVLERAAPDHEVRLAFIRDDEMAAGPPAKGVQFDPAYMSRMIRLGMARGRSNDWNHVLLRPPPGARR